ncbi:MAG TPA: hypothetical protein VHF45_01215 [Thermoleophilaceae bacterium]|nr:hypothetical protein [Thermoleophilaceae bacterium]
MTGAAVAYFTAAVVVTILVRSGDLAAAAPASSVDELAEGDLLGLLTSGLPAAVPLAMPQIALTALAAAVVISREGATVWWVAALVGHVGSALISYGVVGLASALGSGAARDAENDPDYGISAVLAATLGALLASGLRAGDRVAVAVGAGGFAALLPFSIGWLGIQHLLAFGLGAAVALRLRSAERDTPDPCGGAPS